MLTFKELITACKARRLSRIEAAQATGWTDEMITDEALERYIEMNHHLDAEEAAHQLAQCLGEIGIPLFGVGSGKTVSRETIGEKP